MPSKIFLRHARKRRIRAKVQGTPDRPRMSVFRSLRYMTVQLIDDASGKTLASASTKALKSPLNVDGAKKLGETIAQQAKAKSISAVVFDRGGYRYHGRVKALADAAREAGLKF